MISNVNKQWRGYLVVFGAFLIELTLGTVYTTGNLGPYLISYFNVIGSSTVPQSFVVWTLSMQIACQGFVIIPGGFLSAKIGRKYTAMIGCVLMSVGVLTTYFTVTYSSTLLLLTYGILFGFGVGLAYVSVMTTAMLWFPCNRGIVNGIVIGGFGLGAFVFNQVQTHFLNPLNLPPDYTGIFTQKEILNKVPILFLILGGIYLTIQIMGLLLIKEVEIVNDQCQPGSGELSTADFSPLQVLKTKDFYLLWLTMFFNLIVVTFISSMYKVYGQTFIKDDQFLALVGSVSSAVNGSGRGLWGLIIDKSSYKTAMVLLCTSACGLLTIPAITSYMSKAVFMTWMCFLIYTTGGTFSLMPTVTALKFGPKHLNINYGMVFTNVIVAAPLTAVLTDILIAKLHYRGMFNLLTGLSTFSLILTVIL